MSSLGSIFEVDPSRPGEQGPDVRVQVTVRRADIAAGRAVLVSVPDHVLYQGSTVPRRREVGDPLGAVRLHLSPQLVQGATLRLRRQGGEHPTSGVPGDLLVELAIEEPRRLPPTVVVIVAVAATGVAAWWSHGAWWG